jgi:endonuclease YncB( thermonuclease family)
MRSWIGRSSRPIPFINNAHFLLIGFASVAVVTALWHREILRPPIAGHAVVTDGDSLRVGNAFVRLASIDAPELGQLCTTAGNVEWECGLEAQRKLTGLVGDDLVFCRQIEADPYGRVIATCTAKDGRDLAAEMVRTGYALPNGGDSRYIQEEKIARGAGAGMWSGSFQTPWEWRIRMLERQDGCC